MAIRRKKDKNEMSFFEHLEDLRWHIVRSLVVVLLFSIYFLANRFFLFDKIIFAPKDPSFITYNWFCIIGDKLHIAGLCITSISYTLISGDMTQPFLLYIKASFTCGFILAFPYILWEVWRFVRPALYANEKKNLTGLVLIGVFLFYLGAAFGYFILAPFSLNFLGSFKISNELESTFKVDSYIGIITGMVLWSGVIFEIPIIAFFLAKLGLLGKKFLVKNRKFAIVAALFISAIITPSVDMFSQTIVALPLYALFEVSIFVVGRVERKRNKEIFES